MNLKQRRKALKLTQGQMAEKFGLTRQTYQNYENGKTEPTLETAGMMAQFFNCSISDLFDLPAPNISLTEEERRLLDLYSKLNAEGRKKMIGYADDLVCSGKYEKKDMQNNSVSAKASA